MVRFSGIIPPVVTAFSPNGERIDEDKQRAIIRHVIAEGCDGVFVAGSQGEFFSLADSERIALMEIAADESGGRYPVFGGTGAVSTDRAVRMTKAAEKAGVDAVSVINPFFITLDEDELYQYYKSIADATSLPVLIYNNPGRTGANISVALVARLAKIGNIVGMKDSSGDLTYINSVIDTVDKPFDVFCGKDTVIFDELLSGASGAVAASANVAPRLISELWRMARQGDIAGARKAQSRLAPLRNAFALGSFPVVVKEAMAMIGLDAGPCRRPIAPMKEDNRRKLRAVLAGMGLLAQAR